MNNKIFFILLFFLGVACKDEPPVKDDGKTLPPPTNPLQLMVEDVSCTEAFLKLSLATSEQNRTVILKRDTTTIFSNLQLLAFDTLIIDEGLLPNKTYTYKLVYGDWDTTAQATTMDTTSHDWSWEITTLGDGGSLLYDVAIINDTLAYAVGEIHIGDSLYNVAKWDGKNWELLRLMWNCRVYYPNCGPVTQLFSPATAVFAFGPNDVWIASGSVHHFNGTQWSEEGGINGAGYANKIWGDKSSGLYFVGNNGFIASRSISGSWQNIESGTDLQFLDIYGSFNNKTNETQIITVCSRNFPLSKGIFLIQGNSAKQISSFPIEWELYSAWFEPQRHYYVVGSGIYEKTTLLDSVWKNNPLDITRYSISKIRGNTLNDIIAVGSFGECLHFNGVSWKSYRTSATAISGAYGSVAAKKNLAIAVGFVDNKACVAIGKR